MYWVSQSGLFPLILYCLFGVCVCVAAGSVVVPRTGHPEAPEQQRSRPHSEPIPLKNRMAMYQAAVSKQDTPGFSSGVHRLTLTQTHSNTALPVEPSVYDCDSCPANLSGYKTECVREYKQGIKVMTFSPKRS